MLMYLRTGAYPTVVPTPAIIQEGNNPPPAATTTEPPEAFDDMADKEDDMPHDDWIFPEPAAMGILTAQQPLARTQG
jgi:hypothetical protein